MLASSISRVSTAASSHTSSLAPVWVSLLSRGLHSSSSSSSAAAAQGGSSGGGSGSGGADVFTPSLQQKTEEELLQLMLKRQEQPQGKPVTPEAAAAGERLKATAVEGQAAAEVNGRSNDCQRGGLPVASQIYKWLQFCPSRLRLCPVLAQQQLSPVPPCLGRLQVPPSEREEIGGYAGRPEPTRYGDWDVKGRCSDF